MIRFVVPQYAGSRLRAAWLMQRLLEEVDATFETLTQPQTLVRERLQYCEEATHEAIDTVLQPIANQWQTAIKTLSENSRRKVAGVVVRMGGINVVLRHCVHMQKTRAELGLKERTLYSQEVDSHIRKNYVLDAIDAVLPKDMLTRCQFWIPLIIKEK